MNRYLIMVMLSQCAMHGLEATRIMQLPLSLGFDEKKLPMSTVKSHTKTVVCVLDSWSYWRHHPSAKFRISNFDPDLCSQLIYRNAAINETTYAVYIRDNYLAIDLGWVREAVSKSQTHPHLKVLLSIGGWDEGSKRFSKIADDSTKREKFVDSVLRILERHRFHGVDLAWEYPGWESQGGTAEDIRTLPLLLHGLKTALGTKYLLTLTVAGDTDRATSAYNVQIIAKHVDQINVRSFDYHGAWDNRAYHHAALRNSEQDHETQSVINSVKFYLQGGMPPEKIVMGVPLYGKTFHLTEDANSEDDLEKQSGLKQPSHLSFTGAWTLDTQVLGYHEICYNITNTNDWQTYRDNMCSAPFARNGRHWVSFDDTESIETKVNYAVQMGFKGIMAWTIDTDDFTGKACKKGSTDKPVTYPLLRTINYALTLDSEQISDEIGGQMPTGRSALDSEQNDNEIGGSLSTKRPGIQLRVKPNSQNSATLSSLFNTPTLMLLIVITQTAF